MESWRGPPTGGQGLHTADDNDRKGDIIDWLPGTGTKAANERSAIATVPIRDSIGVDK